MGKTRGGIEQGGEKRKKEEQTDINEMTGRDGGLKLNMINPFMFGNAS